MSPLFFLLACVSLIIVWGFIYFGLGSWHDNRLEKIEEKIEEREQILFDLNNKVADKIIDTSVSLTTIEIKCLDLYDSANIRIPSDIIEDLHQRKITNEADIIRFIESQRQHWKLENSKKLFTEKRI
jgi:hypothetical protein